MTPEGIIWWYGRMVESCVSLAVSAFLPPGSSQPKHQNQKDMKKPPYLLTSQEKFRRERGNGSCNTDSPTPTGKPIAAILQPKKDSTSVSQTSVQFPFPKEDTSVAAPVKKTDLADLVKISRYDPKKDYEQEYWVPPSELVDYLAKGFVVHNHPGGSPEETATKPLTSSEIIDKYRKLCLLRTLYRPIKSEE